jgi:hypothetical protein
MIKSPETLVAHPCEKFHEGLISVPDPVPTGRVGHVVESRIGGRLASPAGIRLASPSGARINNQLAGRLLREGGLPR